MSPKVNLIFLACSLVVIVKSDVILHYDFESGQFPIAPIVPEDSEYSLAIDYGTTVFIDAPSPAVSTNNKSIRVKAGSELSFTKNSPLASTVCLLQPMQCQGFTVSFWINIKAFGYSSDTLRVILRTANTGLTVAGVVINIDQGGNNLRFFVADEPSTGNSNYYSSGIALSSLVDAWKFVTITWAKNEDIKMFINAELQTASVTPVKEERLGITGKELNPLTLRVGNELGPEFYMDELMVQNKVLNAEEITALYDAVIGYEATTTPMATTKPVITTKSVEMTTSSASHTTCRQNLLVNFIVFALFYFFYRKKII